MDSHEFQQPNPHYQPLTSHMFLKPKQTELKEVNAKLLETYIKQQNENALMMISLLKEIRDLLAAEKKTMGNNRVLMG